MSYFRLLLTNTSIVSFSAILSACSGAPSEAELKEAVHVQNRSQQEAAERMVGKQFAGMMSKQFGEMTDLKKIGCKENGERAYLCDVEIEFKRGDQVGRTPLQMRVVKGSEGWMVSK